MLVKVSLVLLTVINLSVAFDFQSAQSQSFLPEQLNHPSTENKEVKKSISDLKEQKIRLERQEQLISEHEDVITEQAKRLSKQRELLDQQTETLKVHETQIKEQGKRIDAQRQVLSEAIVSKKEEVKRLTNVEEKLNVRETFGLNGYHRGNFTNLEKVGLSFALVERIVQNQEMEDYCRKMVEGGRLIVLDSKSKYEAMKDYLDQNSDGVIYYYIGLKKGKGKRVHHWSNGKQVDDNFWCSGPGKPHYSPCTTLTRHPYRPGYCIGVKPCSRGSIICEKPQH